MKTIQRFIQAADSYTDYDKQPRQYGTDDIVYMSEAYFLQAAARCDKPEIGKIAERLGVTPGAASQTAAKLEAKGLITRVRSTEDSRVVLVRLSERAKKLNAYHDELDLREFGKLGDRMMEFSPGETDAIYRFLEIINSFFHEDIEGIMKDWKYRPENE
ncbi:MAG: MarR family transcriptional regulator [Solobacterium sp.]|nr:MarR family transcriptional regulator [Solobacterium sp.]